MDDVQNLPLYFQIALQSAPLSGVEWQASLTKKTALGQQRRVTRNYGVRSHRSYQTPLEFEEHPTVRSAYALTYQGLEYKLPRWYDLLARIREGAPLRESMKAAHFSFGMCCVWRHTDPQRDAEFREAMYAAGRRPRDQRVVTPTVIDDVFSLMTKHGLARACAMAKIAKHQFKDFIRMHPTLQETYEHVQGRPFSARHRLLDEYEWDQYFELLPLCGPVLAARHAKTVPQLTVQRLQYDPDFRAQVMARWNGTRAFAYPAPQPVQLENILVDIPTLGSVPAACYHHDVDPSAFATLQALNLPLEQQVAEQLREAERCQHPRYAQWAETDEAQQPFATLYQQTHIREEAYQRCLQRDLEADVLHEAKYKVDPHARETFAERHGLTVA